MNPDPESELVTEAQTRVAVLRAMAARFGSSIKALGLATGAVCGVLGSGLIALVAWRHDALSVTIAVAGVIVVVVLIAWFRAEADHLAIRAGYFSFRRRAAARTGYYELPNTGIPNTGYGVAPGFGHPMLGGGGGNAGNGGEVRGSGTARGGGGGNGGLSRMFGGTGGYGGHGGHGGKVDGSGSADGGRGGDG